MKRDAGSRQLRLQCPCGEYLVGDDEDHLVVLATEHLRGRHPELADVYSRDDILAIAF